MMDLILTNTQLFSLQDVNCWSGVDCGFSCLVAHEYESVLIAPHVSRVNSDK